MKKVNCWIFMLVILFLSSCGNKVAQPTNPVGRVYGRQPKTVAKRYIIAPKVSTFAL